MATIRFTQTTTASPEQFIAGLTDFGPGRGELFGNSSDSFLKVHDQSPGHADVTEGSNGIWERLSYDWTDPHHIVLKTTESNLWGPGSGHSYTLTERPDGKTDVAVVVDRVGMGLKGKALGFVLSLGGQRLIGKMFEKTLRAIEARAGKTD
jgi:hypothetical protein